MSSHSHRQSSVSQPSKPENNQVKIDELLTALSQAQEREKKALADYQNLLRRTQEDRQVFVKIANQDVILSLLEPLQHLNMTAEQLKSPVLDSVVKSIWLALANQGLEEINCLGLPFDAQTMEAVDVTENETKDHKHLVKTIIRPGYRLNGQVIQVAKVGL